MICVPVQWRWLIVRFEGDGETRMFTVQFKQKLEHKPVVTFSTNRFERSRLAEQSRKGFEIEFEKAIEDGEEIVVNWIIQQ
jgi:hypothetical protein